MLANRMIMALKKRRIDRSTPTNIITANADLNPAYIGKGTILRLSNGWLIATLKISPGIVFYKSIDNGSTWTQLCYKTLTPITGLSVVSDGTTVYCAYTLNGYAYAHILKFDAVTQTNSELSLLSYVTSGEARAGLDMVISSTGVLHVAFGHKLGTSNSYCSIIYAKSSDNGATWTKVDGTAGTNNVFDQYVSDEYMNNVTITLTASGYPCVASVHLDESVAEYTSYRTEISTWNGSTWVGGYCIWIDGNYCMHPYSLTSLDGVIHLVYVYDSGRSIRYRKSTDNGATWSAEQSLVSGANFAAPHLAADKDSNIYVYYLDTYSIKARVYTKSSNSWGTVYTILSYAPPVSFSYSTLCVNYDDFTAPLCVFLEHNSSSGTDYIKFMGEWDE